MIHTPWLSDHCPIYTDINLNVPIASNTKETVKVHKKEPSFIWDDEDKEGFITYLRNDTIKSKVHNLLNDQGVQPIELAKTIRDILISSASSCNIRRSKKNNKHSEDPWFDKECTKAKNVLYNLGKNLKHTPCNGDIRTELFQQKKKFQKLVREKKREYKKSIITEMSKRDNKE